MQRWREKDSSREGKRQEDSRLMWILLMSTHGCVTFTLHVLSPHQHIFDILTVLHTLHSVMGCVASARLVGFRDKGQEKVEREDKDYRISGHKVAKG